MLCPLTVTQSCPEQQPMSLRAVPDSCQFHSALSWTAPSLHSALSRKAMQFVLEILWHCTFTEGIFAGLTWRMSPPPGPRCPSPPSTCRTSRRPAGLAAPGSDQRNGILKKRQLAKKWDFTKMGSCKIEILKRESCTQKILGFKKISFWNKWDPYK